MNRKQRREKFTGVEVEALKALAYANGVQDATSAIYASTLLVLRDKFGFGAIRAERLLAAITDQVDSINKGYVSIEDMKQTVNEELGIKLKYERNEK